jgi:hypothetical protein
MFQGEKTELLRFGRMITVFRIYICRHLCGMSLMIRMAIYLLPVPMDLFVALQQNKVGEPKQMSNKCSTNKFLSHLQRNQV